MFKFWWPIGLIILSSVGYQVGLKEVSTGMDPFVALVVTYLVASAVSFAILHWSTYFGHKISKIRCQKNK